MVRLTDLSEQERAHLLNKNTGPLGPLPWVANDRPLRERRIALVTTAGLHRRGEDPFDFADASFRPIAADEDGAALVMSHSSVNFDRSGFQDDVNVVFPIDRFRELEADGTIGSLASVHYSFMGAGLAPETYAASARRVSALLERDRVDTVFLTPV